MDLHEPIQPQGFRFSEQHDSDFDEMTFRLVRLEFPEAVKLAAPDGGIDTLLPAPGHACYPRGWQAKRFTGSVSWSQCKASLDRAVETYGVEHVTFCFARNLTTKQEALFVKHLVTRHAAVIVDYWNSSELTARLTGSDEGRRVARHFFGAHDVLERIERGQRAGGVLASGQDAQERALAVGEFMASGDPYFAYPLSVGETGLPIPAPPSGTVMSVEQIRGKVVARTDVIPRDQEAMERYRPKGRLLFSADEKGEAALDAVQRVLRDGGEAQIETGMVAWDQLPPMFADMVGSTMQGSVRIVAPRPVAKWTARVTADTNLGRETMDFELAPARPENGWDFALAGTTANLVLLFRGRWLEAEGRGEVKVDWRHTLDTTRVGDQPRALAMLKALHGTGTVLIEDLTGDRPQVSQKLILTEYPQELADLQVLLEAIALVEGRAGVNIGVPEVITAQEANDLTLVSACIREGGQDLIFKSAEFLAAPDSPLLQADPITEVRIEQHLDARVFGRILDLGKTRCEMPPLRIITRMPAPEEGDGYQLLTVAPASGGPAVVRAVLQPLGEG